MFRIPSCLVRSRAPVALQHRTSSLALLSTYPAAQRPQLHQRISHVSGFSTPRSFHSVAPLEAESKRGQEKLRSDPSKIAAETKSFDDLTLPGAHPIAGVDGGGLKHDIDVVRDALRLSRTPRESHILGLMGTVPYFATSAASVFLSWDLTKDLPAATPFYNAILINHDTAKYLLSIIEPLQLGYGAVIISFLGAVHWGLEYAEKEPHPERTRFRYGMGVVAPIIAWPTLLMPLEYGLITQFAAFVALYFADSRATIRGWAPPWYGHYRFLLTAMVGFALFISLVGRSRIETSQRLSGRYLSESIESPGVADTTTDWVKVEAEEKKRIKKEKEEKEKQKEKEAKKSQQEEMIKDKNGGKGKQAQEEGKPNSDNPKSGTEADKTQKGEDDQKEKDDQQEKDDQKGKDGQKGEDGDGNKKD
ncbi:unnamed protein product [Clonostachys solani]|uniref:Mitochondrial inner membrane protein 1 n=1 Tax=Clonostachys solani TaxID=160281 RepID=A0A9P0EBM3_9HYPO|nr:unnamed protein product [Clonostachys solani]